MGFFTRRKRKTALRTPNTYTQDRMTQDHLASTALFYAATAHTPVDPDEQREDVREDDQSFDQTEDNDAPVSDESDDVAPESEPTPEPATEQNVTTPNEPYSYEAPEYSAPVTEVYQPSYSDSGSSYSSSYDSGSSYSSSSYDSGGSSYDSGSSGGGFD